jgi:hypothetical protein
MTYKDDDYYERKSYTQDNSTNYMTQHEVAEAMQITRSQVDTIEKKALRKLRYLVKLKYEKEDFL